MRGKRRIYDPHGSVLQKWTAQLLPQSPAWSVVP